MGFEKGSAFFSSQISPSSIAFASLQFQLSLIFLSFHLQLPPALTLLAKSYLKPEYLSLGFFQSATFSSTAATTCEERLRLERIKVLFGDGDDTDANVAAAGAERLAVTVVEGRDTDLREDAKLLVLVDCRKKGEETTEKIEKKRCSNEEERSVRRKKIVFSLSSFTSFFSSLSPLVPPPLSTFFPPPDNKCRYKNLVCTVQLKRAKKKEGGGERHESSFFFFFFKKKRKNSTFKSPTFFLNLLRLRRRRGPLRLRPS